MKKLVFLFVLLFSLQNEAKTQDTVYIVRETIREIHTVEKVRVKPGKDVIPKGRNEILLQAGWSPYMAIDFNDEKGYFGSYAFKYSRYINDRFSVGFTIGYLRTHDFTTYDNTGEEEDYYANLITYMGHFNLNYFNRNGVTLYMGVSLGLLTITDHDRDYSNGSIQTTYNKDRLTVPVAEITAFGIKMYDKPVSPFFEIGLGLEGFVRGGLSFRF